MRQTDSWLGLHPQLHAKHQRRLPNGGRGREAERVVGEWFGIRWWRMSVQKFCHKNVIKMRKMQQFKNAKYARMRGMITTEKRREGQGTEGRARAVR